MISFGQHNSELFDEFQWKFMALFLSALFRYLILGLFLVAPRDSIGFELVSWVIFEENFQA
jgi:hypothetical protein